MTTASQRAWGLLKDAWNQTILEHRANPSIGEVSLLGHQCITPERGVSVEKADPSVALESTEVKPCSQQW